MQRRSLLAVAATAILLVTGCSNDSSGGSGSGGSKTLTLMAISDNKPGYDPIVAAFEKEHPGVTVKVTYGTGNDFESIINTQLAGGNAADVLAVQPGIGNLVSVGSLGKKGYLADLSGQSWAAKIPPNLKSQTDFDGKTYMYPEFMQPLGAFYNSQAVKAAGLTAPTTWTQLLAYCKAAKDKGKVAFSLGLSDQWVTQLVPYALAATLVYGKTPDWNAQLIAGTVTFPDSEWKTVEQKYLELNAAGCFSKNPNGISYDNTLPPVAKGDALGIVQVGGILGTLQSKNNAVAYELQPLPATDNPAETNIPASLGVGLGVNAKSKNKDLALQFVEYVARPEVTNGYVETIGGGIPAIANDAFTAPQGLASFAKLVQEGKINAYPDTGWPNPQVQNAHLVGIQNMFLGKATPDQVLKNMQDAVKK
jgi:raffinose/stachyose/melibiose transport system substrate-binding protein